MNWGVLNGAMLLGVAGAAIPIVIHFLNRRRDRVVDWGAMQFLEPGRLARRNIRLTELLLMLARMALLAGVAIALARPFWASGGGSAPAATTAAGGWGTGSPRDVVIVIDGSAGMDRRLGGTSPRALAARWARSFAGRLGPGDSVAVLIAGARVRPLIDPPSFDRAKVDAALAGLRLSRSRARGSSDLAAALGEAFRILERTENPRRDVVVLTDGRRAAWRPGEPRRWALVRDLHRRLPVPPRLWSVTFGLGLVADAPDGSVGPLAVSRAWLAPGLPVEVTTAVGNAGPGPLSRTAELLIDGQPVAGAARAVGPVPAGGKALLSFRAALPGPGSHLLTVRLVGGDDALPGDDESSIPVEVKEALPVVLIDGGPGLEPFRGATDFLRAALAPTGDDAPQVRARTATLDTFSADSLRDQSVAVLANVERLRPEQAAALARFVESGGGLLIAPGAKIDADMFHNLGIAPARPGARKGGAREVVAHPAPRSFTGPAMAPFGEGSAPPLAGAGLFGYWVLTPAPGSTVAARLDTGDPWVVERPQGKGRVMLLAGPLDAEGGTLPVNPDFVPLVHEWVFHLAGGAAAKEVRPGEPLVFDVTPAPPESVKSLPLQRPDGTTADLPLARTSATAARVRVDDTTEPGVYRLTLPEGFGFAYATVAGDGRSSDPDPLEPAEAATLAEGWPLAIETDPERLATRLFETDRGGKREVWRALVLAALGGLCVEIWLTRKLVRGQGIEAR